MHQPKAELQHRRDLIENAFSDKILMEPTVLSQLRMERGEEVQTLAKCNYSCHVGRFRRWWLATWWKASDDIYRFSNAEIEDDLATIKSLKITKMRLETHRRTDEDTLEGHLWVTQTWDFQPEIGLEGFYLRSPRIPTDGDRHTAKQFLPTLLGADHRLCEKDRASTCPPHRLRLDELS
jgi:hypothetical protein